MPGEGQRDEEAQFLKAFLEGELLLLAIFLSQ